LTAGLSWEGVDLVKKLLGYFFCVMLLFALATQAATLNATAVASVPEPATLLLLGSGLLGVGVFVRKKFKK